LLVPEQHGAGGAVLADAVERAVEGMGSEPFALPVGQEVGHHGFELAENVRGYILGGYVGDGGLGVRPTSVVFVVFVDVPAREVDDLCVA
jgi:hypothetical protein